MPREEQIKLLNSRIEYYFQSLNDQRKLLEDEKHIINDSWFEHAISYARDELGIEDFFEDPTGSGVEEWPVNQIAKRTVGWNDPEFDELLQKVTNAVAATLDRARLHPGWYEHIMVYIATGSKPHSVKIEREPLARVVDIDESSVRIEFEKGFNGKDYNQLWYALRPFLRQSNQYLPNADSLKNKIYLDHREGLGVTEIAKRYYPREYAIDPIATRDKVKKVIARFK